MSNTNSRNIVLAGTVLLAFVALVATPSLFAQAVSIASVTGHVTDVQGALVAGAQIRMIGVETGAVYSAVPRICPTVESGPSRDLRRVYYVTPAGPAGAGGRLEQAPSRSPSVQVRSDPVADGW